MSWSTEGVKTNPGPNTILADTGPLTQAEVDLQEVPIPQITVSADVNVTVLFQLRNAADNATVAQQAYAVGAYAPLVIQSPRAFIQLNSGQRFRVVLTAGITGNVQASLFLWG